MVDVLFSDVMTAEEVASGICTVYLKTVCVATISRYETYVVEHGACVKEFGVELEATVLACECAKIVDSAGVVEQQCRFCIADEFRNFVGELAVRNSDARDTCYLRSLS
jgi:hypothetical protein